MPNSLGDCACLPQAGLINQATTLNLPHVKAKPVKQKRIEQIDIIWAQAVYETPESLNPWETAYH